MSRFSFVSLKLFICFVCKDSGRKHTRLSTPPSPPTHTRFLLLLLFLSLSDSEMTATDRRNRRGSSLGRSCSLERFQGSEPPKPTNRGDGRRLSSCNQYDIAKCPLIEPHRVQKKDIMPSDSAAAADQHRICPTAETLLRMSLSRVH